MTGVHFSVALCTYNGEQYLREQFVSIFRQTLPPSEIVVCDDGSTDRTRELLAELQSSAPCTLRIVHNAVNLRSTANFAQAIALCSGDVIVLSDQDDRWRPRKLETFAQLFSNRPELEVVFTNADLIDAAGQPTGNRLWDGVGFTAPFQQRVASGDLFRVLLKRYVMTGATMAFRSRLRAAILPIPPSWVHDAWIAMICAATSGPVEMCPDPLTEYRIHPQQQIGCSRMTRWQQYQFVRKLTAEHLDTQAKQFADAAQRVAELCGSDHPHTRQLQAKVQHLQRRAVMRSSGRFQKILGACRELTSGSYERYSLGIKTCLADMLT